MENIETGLLLMVVGMTTVFAILLIVIYLGKGLITLVNKYDPEEEIAKKQVATASPLAFAQSGAVGGQETAAIVSAISMVTGGKGRVVKIEKM